MGKDLYSTLEEMSEENEAQDAKSPVVEPKSETEILKEALQFYGTEENYIPTDKKNSIGDRYLSPSELDGGEKARIALELTADKTITTNK